MMAPGAAVRSIAEPATSDPVIPDFVDELTNSATLPAPTEKAERVAAPPAERFVRFPAAWYLLCTAHELRAGPVGKRVFDRELVAFRPTPGQVVVMDAQ